MNFLLSFVFFFYVLLHQTNDGYATSIIIITFKTHLFFVLPMKILFTNKIRMFCYDPPNVMSNNGSSLWWKERCFRVKLWKQNRVIDTMFEEERWTCHDLKFSTKIIKKSKINSSTEMTKIVTNTRLFSQIRIWWRFNKLCAK